MIFTNENELLEELFIYNLECTAKSLGITDEVSATLSDVTATKLLNIAEYYSLQTVDRAKIKSLLICCLIWENRKEHWLALKPFISRILIRIGQGTSAKMVNWLQENDKFGSLGSFIDDLEATRKMFEHEISFGESNLLLSNFQKRMWDSIDSHNRVGISAPTSAGKSFILVHKAVDIISKVNGTVIFVVPTISLITQVTSDLRKLLRSRKITDVSLYQNVNNISLFKAEKLIYVLTQERLLNALNNQENPFEDIKMLVIDEVQNVEKVSSEDEERAKTLFDSIQELKNNHSVEKIVISGPRLKNIDDIVKKWFGPEGESVSEDVPSVLNISYSFKKIKRRPDVLLLSQHLPLGVVSSIEVRDKFLLRDKVLGKKFYTDEIHSFISNIISNSNGAGTIVFTGKTKQAKETAKEISKILHTDTSNDRISFSKFIADTVHPLYSLSETVKSGIAFHHSKVPQHLRNLIEKCFGMGTLNTVVSTTTLMQGVNLPAKNIIIRNPSVGKNEQLTGYEFSNLKGRAGRLMKDLVGRAIIIDEQECEDQSIKITVPEEKNLKLGYGDRFKDNRTAIEQALSEHRQEDLLNADLITYIRNIALRYGKNGIKHLNEVGINIAVPIFNSVLQSLAQLALPRPISLSNPYWDPFVLNNIYHLISDGKWPEIPTSIRGLGNGIYDSLSAMQDIAPAYVSKYFGIDPNDEHGSRKTRSLCSFADSWANGHPLKEVINPENWPITDDCDIDNRVSDLHTSVIYGIPKLLRPVFQISDHLKETKSSALLGFIEAGAYDTKIRALIEMGIPRETAIVLGELPNANYLESDGKINGKSLKTFISNARSDINISRWHRMLFEEI